jgi:hypothetical protein
MTRVATKALILKKIDELLPLMFDLWHVARKHLTDCPPFPASFEAVGERCLELDDCLPSNLEDIDSSDSDGNDE